MYSFTQLRCLGYSAGLKLFVFLMNIFHLSLILYDLLKINLSKIEGNMIVSAV